ncbi:SpoIIE family protein phosphatase [Psychrobacillus lasiicapitis]|uniref:Fused response regulator/phosphatase n=1 Tax=Psychrobacillus lasiicapitis TaxID=1636719 RepID=A0A544SX12_9BACI|nr:fused response regulator/phosphatase [Psychrobacillus lasiicapitis]TQR09752.1 fused response regulator/phosphatase [Psychrobacillus lasiicapitis]GGA23194.1 transcriptional regulator [Psychrobacillus lasiicapitis]
MTILMVDDNSVNLFVIESILKKAGYENCHPLNSAEELFQYLRLDEKEAPAPMVDLILLDIMMPKIDGIEACRRIQQDERLKEIPIIFLTALNDSRHLVEAFEVGGTDYVTKPIDKLEFLARVRLALRLKFEKDRNKEQEAKMQEDLLLAMQVQGSLLNDSTIDKHLSIQVFHSPSDNLSGDMYHWHKFSDHRYGIILFDMMGHGISASLVSMFISSVLRDAIKNLEDPALVIKELNRYMTSLHNKNNLNYYFTAIYLIIDTEKREIEYVNAGHPPGFLRVDGTLLTMERGACAVGLFDEIHVRKSKLSYNGDIQLLLYTDGIIESEGIDEMEALEKLQTITCQEWKEDECLFHKILSDINQSNQKDDICLLMIKTK